MARGAHGGENTKWGTRKTRRGVDKGGSVLEGGDATHLTLSLSATGQRFTTGAAETCAKLARRRARPPLL